MIDKSGSLAGALRTPGSDLLLTCYAIELDDAGAIESMPATGCTAAHHGEFVGLWDAGDRAYPAAGRWAAFHDGCRGLIADHTGVPDDEDLQYRTGVIPLPGSADTRGWAAPS